MLCGSWGPYEIELDEDPYEVGHSMEVAVVIEPTSRNAHETYIVIVEVYITHGAPIRFSLLSVQMKS